MSATVDMPTASPRDATTESGAPVVLAPKLDQDQRLADLAEIIQSYNAVTEKLQRSHEVLQGEVLRLQEELAGKNAQLQRSKRLAALGEMAAGIAHEIRNPLAAIHLYARMLVEDLGDWRNGAVPADVTPQHETAEKIAGAVRGLNAIVTDVLSFSTGISPRPSCVDAAELFARVVDTHRPAIDAAGVGVVIEADRIQLFFDSELAHRAILNVVRNAVDAMSNSKIESKVLSLRACADDGEGCSLISVRDTGPGIEAAEIDRIFNPFFTTRSTGTGLGLAIVHRIVDAHGGSIRVFNDGGAVFEMRFPLARKVEEQTPANASASKLVSECVALRRSA